MNCNSSLPRGLSFNPDFLRSEKQEYIRPILALNQKCFIIAKVEARQKSPSSGFFQHYAFFPKFSTGVTPVISADTKRFACTEGHFISIGTLRHFEKTFQENL